MSIKTLTVVVKAETVSKSANANPNQDEDEKGGNALYNALHYNQIIKKKLTQATSPTTVFALYAGVNLAKQTIKQGINYYLSNIGRQSGDSNYQAMINRRIEQVTDPLSVGGAALAGAMGGSMFGPVGTVVGAAVGAIGQSFNLAFKYGERERAYQHELFKDRNSQAYQLSRANYSALTGRAR